jgi:hypothetical protein
MGCNLWKSYITVPITKCLPSSLVKRVLSACSCIRVRMAAGSDDGALVVIERKDVYDSLGNYTAALTLLGVWSDRRIQLSRCVLEPCGMGKRKSQIRPLHMKCKLFHALDCCFSLFKTCAYRNVNFLRCDLEPWVWNTEDITCTQRDMHVHTAMRGR